MRMWLRAALAVMLAVVVAVPALAQQSVDGKTDKDFSFVRIGGMQSADSTKTMLRLDASGSVLVTDASRDRDLYYEESVLACTLNEIGDADSTDVLDISGYALTGLSISSSGGGIVAVQVRHCLGGLDDSTHTFPFAVREDSTASLGIVSDGVTSTSAAAGSTEMVVKLHTLGVSGPLRRVHIPLSGVMDMDRVQYVSIRVRYLVRDVDADNIVKLYATGSALR